MHMSEELRWSSRMACTKSLHRYSNNGMAIARRAVAVLHIGGDSSAVPRARSVLAALCQRMNGPWRIPVLLSHTHISEIAIKRMQQICPGFELIFSRRDRTQDAFSELDWQHSSYHELEALFFLPGSFEVSFDSFRMQGSAVIGSLANRVSR